MACVQWHCSRPSLGNFISGAVPTQNGPARRRSVIILPRDAHKSAVHALVLSGATPCFLPPLRHPDSGVSLGIGTAAIQAALEECGEEVCKWTPPWEIGSSEGGINEDRDTRTDRSVSFFLCFTYTSTSENDGQQVDLDAPYSVFTLEIRQQFRYPVVFRTYRVTKHAATQPKLSTVLTLMLLVVSEHAQHQNHGSQVKPTNNLFLVYTLEQARSLQCSLCPQRTRARART